MQKISKELDRKRESKDHQDNGLWEHLGRTPNSRVPGKASKRQEVRSEV